MVRRIITRWRMKRQRGCWRNSDPLRLRHLPQIRQFTFCHYKKSFSRIWGGLGGGFYAKLSTWKHFPLQLTPLHPNSSKTPNIIKDSPTNSKNVARASVKEAAKNIASDRKSRANSSCANRSEERRVGKECRS